MAKPDQQVATQPIRGPRAGRRRAAAVVLLLGLALVARLAFVAATPDYRPIHDDRDYDRLGCAILELGAYPAAGPRVTPQRCRAGAGGAGRSLPTAYRPPGYPAFLAAVYGASAPVTSDRWTAARVAQALVGTVAVALVGLVAWQLWGAAVGLVALGLAAVWLPWIVVGASLFSETLFVALMLGALAAVLALRRSPHALRWALLAGVLTGLAALTRSNGALLLLALVAGSWVGRPRLSLRAVAPPLALALAAIVVVAPWTLRNAHALGAFVPVSTELGGTVAGTYNATANADRVFPASWKLAWDDPTLKRILDRHRDEEARDRAFRAAAVHYVRAHPLYPAKVAYWNARRLFDLTGPRWWRFSGHTLGLGDGVSVAAAVWVLPFLLLALAGALTARARRAPAFVWLALAAALVAPVLVIAELRFRAPVDAFVILLAALALTAPRLSRRWA
jgi:4-amino-4-deoxy-L-arabinose transferase-like glycosyltransferase